MAKKLIALLLAVMLIMSLTVPAYAVETYKAPTAANTRTVTVGVINYVINDIGAEGYQVHYWGGSTSGDADLTATGKTEQKSVGSSYWNNAAQTFSMYTAEIPADAIGFKVHNGDRWFGDDGATQNRAYIFNYSGDKALYENVAEPTEAPVTEAPVTEAPATEAETTAEETITVKFTDALGWGSANVYYWPNGGDWPGKAMDKAEVNEYDQTVYTAAIPADVDGIIFNGNGNQTVDIKDGIVDGAQWYTVDEKDGSKYKVNLVTDEPETQAEETSAPETQAAVDGKIYFKPGEWANDNARFGVWVSGWKYYTSEWFALESVGDGIYAADLTNTSSWVSCKFARFDPETEGFDGAWNTSAEVGFENGKLYTVKEGEWENAALIVTEYNPEATTEPATEAATEAETTAPATEAETTAPAEGAYYVVGTFNEWTASDAYKLTAVDGAETEEYTITLDLTKDAQLKVIYTDGENTTWFPEGMDNNYIVTADGKYDIYFRPKYDGKEDWHEKVLYAAAQTIEVPTEEETAAPATEAATEAETTAPATEAETTAPAEGAYYVVGTFNEWTAADAYKLTAVEGAETEEYTITLDLTKDAQLKVIYTDGENTTWFPEGMDNNYIVTADGKYDIYFRPKYDGKEDWYEKVLYAAAQTIEVPTEEETAAPATEAETTSDETTAPVETITVKFTDAMNYGDVNIYYWPNGGDWPGKAMDKVDVNDFDQTVYTASIPADVDGIIFNGNGRQTVDITEGIADGAWWYTVEDTDDSGHNYVKLVGDEPATEAATESETTAPATEAETTAPAEGAYYVVGTFNEWTASDAYKLTAVDGAETEEYTITLDLTKDAQLKVIYTDGENTTWFPEGMDNNYIVTADGKYDVYFRPKYDGKEDWHEKVLYAAAQTIEVPTEEETEAPATEPATEAETTVPATTITVKFTDALGWGDVHVYYWDNGAEWPGTAMDKAEVNEFGQQVYTATIPADVKGVIFNGNGKQTVDIKDGIVDGAWWYTVEDTDDLGHNYVKLVGDEPATEAATEAETTAPATEAETTAPAEGAYYVVGTFNEWTAADAYKLTAVDGAETEEYTITLDLTKDAQLKVIYTDGENTTWFPEGMDNNYIVTADGKYDIYFRPKYDGKEDWHEKVLYAAAQTIEVPTEEATAAPATEAATEAETTAPATEAETTAPATTITVKFTDALYWGDVHVYYWDNGAEWPGTAMDKAEVNEFGQQVYTATIPADVKGVIFNGNGNQTVDITEGIADGAQWYTVDEKEGNNYKVNLVTDEPATEAATEAETTAPATEAETTAPVEAGYYLVGSMNNWEIADAYKLTKTEAEAEEYTITLSLSKDDQFKIATADGKWFPDGVDNNYVVTADGEYDVYFRPNYDGYDDWFSGCIYAAAKAIDEPTETETTAPATEAETTAPATEAETTVPAETITVKFTDALGWGDVHVYYWDNGAEWPGTAMDKAEVNEFGQQVYTATIPADVKGIIFNGNGNQTVDITEGIADGAQWYTVDEKEGNNYKVNLVTDEPATEAETIAPATEAETTAPVEAGYYLVGSMNNWEIADAYKLTKTEAEAEEYTITLSLSKDDQFKIATADGKWFPDGVDNNYVVTADGEYDVYFRPNYDGYDDWFSGCIYAAAKAIDEPTEAETTAPATEAETTAPATTITVKFTDALGWGDVHVYYWDNGAEWPGTAMDKAEVNEFGQQVYTATIPADVKGVIFNGNGNQTVDITEGIADGAQWYTVDEKEGNNYKVNLVTDEPATEAATEAETTAPATEAETTAPAEGAYYVVGSFNEWTAADAYKLTAVDGAETEEYTITLDLTKDAQLKVIYTDGENTTWFPEGMDNNYIVTADGEYDVYFRPNYDGYDDWFSGCIYAAAKAIDEPTEAETTAPATEAETTAPATTITVKFTDALGWGDVHVYYWDNGAEWPGTAMDKAEVNEFGQQVYTATIPADVKGVIFNGNGNQTVDITEGIADGAWWYTVDEKDGSKYKVNLVTDEPATEAETTAPATEAETTAPVEAGYYLVGTMNNWEIADAYKLTKTEAEAEEYTITLSLSKDDQFKIATADGKWFPDGVDNNYVVTADGEYDVYFRPNYDGYDDWFSGCIYAAAKTVDEPTETETTAPATEAETTAPATEAETTVPAETITVKFTDALYWGDVHVYYWDNGAEWPGTAMDKAEVNEFGQQVYTATIPADVKGVIFNGNGKQTVDIKDGIVDGAWWYTVEDTDDLGHNYVKLVGDEPATEAATEAETTAPATEAETTAPALSDYFLVGNLNDWSFEDEYALTKNTAAETEEYMISVDLTAASQFKIVKLDGLTMTWFPTGVGNNYGQNGEITANGTYTVYFRPNYDGGEDWFNGCIYVALESEAPTEVIPTEPATEAATEAETTAPATEAETTAPAPSDYFLVGNLNDWSFEDEYALTKNTAAETEEYMISVDLTTASQFKIVKLDGLTMTWFPTGVENNYGQNGEITANGTYTVYFRPNYDGGEDWFNGCIYVALESEAPTEVIPTEPATQPETTSGEIILGDVDGDGEVTSLDATYIQRQMAFMDVKTFNETAADIDGDGEITSLDVTYIQRYLAFMDVKYPIDQPI